MAKHHPITNAAGIAEGPLPTTPAVDEDHLQYQRPRRRTSTTAQAATPPDDLTALRAQLQQAQKDRDRWKFLSRKNETRFRTLATALDEQGISAQQLLKDASITSKHAR